MCRLKSKFVVIECGMDWRKHMKKRQWLLLIPLFLVATLVVILSLVELYERKVISLEPSGELTEIVDATETMTDENTTEYEFIEETETINETMETEDGKLEWEFVTSDVSYFSDALFVGDSRMVGIAEYGNLDTATFFVVQGMSIHNLWSRLLPVADIGEVTLEELLTTNTYGKIYLMLGYNELGYNQDYSAGKYKDALDRIHEMQPDAIIYICSNLHVTEELSTTSDRYNNVNINSYNEKLSALADEKTFFYLEVNELFDDENGNLGDQYSGDNTHLYVKYYIEWSNWFCQKTIKR